MAATLGSFGAWHLAGACGCRAGGRPGPRCHCCWSSRPHWSAPWKQDISSRSWDRWMFEADKRGSTRWKTRFWMVLGVKDQTFHNDHNLWWVNMKRLFNSWDPAWFLSHRNQMELDPQRVWSKRQSSSDIRSLHRRQTFLPLSRKPESPARVVSLAASGKLFLQLKNHSSFTLNSEPCHSEGSLVRGTNFVWARSA